MGVRPPQPRTKHQGPVTTEFDVPIPLRDGVVVRGNIHRPTARLDDRLPVIFNYSLYGKDGGVDISFFPPSSGLDKARVTDEYLFEAADPGWWCLQGFVVVAIDARGSFQSDGDKSYYSRDVGIDGVQHHINSQAFWLTNAYRLRLGRMASRTSLVERQSRYVRCQWLCYGSVACSCRATSSSISKQFGSSDLTYILR